MVPQVLFPVQNPRKCCTNYIKDMKRMMQCPIISWFTKHLLVNCTRMGTRTFLYVVFHVFVMEKITKKFVENNRESDQTTFPGQVKQGAKHHFLHSSSRSFIGIRGRS